MVLEDIIEQLEIFCPPRYALDWDNVGLHVGRRDSRIAKVLVTVDVNDEAVDQAVREEVDLIVSHHPFMFHGILQANDTSVTGRRLLTLAENRIACYCMHTNFDVMGGMAERIADKLGMTELEVLEVTADGHGIGVIGNLTGSDGISLPEGISLSEACDLVKETMELPRVSFYGNSNQRIRRIAIVPGSGKDDIPLAIEKKADLLLTGDMTYHYGIDATAEGLAVIDAGHFGLEKTFMDIMTEFLRKTFPELNLLRAEYENPQQYR